MKYSFYNTITQKGGYYLLYNTFTQNLLGIDSALWNVIEANKDNVSELKNIHPELYTQLLNDKFVVDKELDEKQIYIKKLQQRDQKIDYSNFRLIINPTLDCNFRCWYCYEKHLEGSIMDKDTLANVEIYIKKLLSNKSLKTFTLSFFGGEPLMKFYEIIFPLIIYTKELCEYNGITFISHFTSNAFLLTQNITDLISSNNIKLIMQVPFDGNEIKHNTIKKSSTGANSYRKTLQNVFYALERNVTFIIRFNCTEKNMDSFRELVDEFKHVKDKSLVVFSIQRIWQEHITEELLRRERELRQYIYEEGFNKYDNGVEIGKCYADGQNSVVINYNGNIYKCTANDFTEKTKEGRLLDNGIIEYNTYHNSSVKI